jgi:hypothetical protein
VERVLLNEVIWTDYGQLDLVWTDTGGFDGDFDRFFNGQVNGLVGAADTSGVYLNLARRSGGSPVRIVLRDGPAELDDAFQDVVEVSITIPPGAVVQWMSWAAETRGVLSEVPTGSYRLRVSARDRDEGASGEFADGFVDAYLLELWESSVTPDAVLRAGSADAEYWHREVGNRR